MIPSYADEGDDGDEVSKGEVGEDEKKDFLRKICDCGSHFMRDSK